MTTLNQNAMLIDGIAKCREICADFGYSLEKLIGNVLEKETSGE